VHYLCESEFEAGSFVHCRVIGLLDLSKLLRLRSSFDGFPPPIPGFRDPRRGRARPVGGLRSRIPPGATGAAVGAGIESVGFAAGVSTLGYRMALRGLRCGRFGVVLCPRAVAGFELVVVGEVVPPRVHDGFRGNQGFKGLGRLNSDRAVC